MHACPGRWKEKALHQVGGHSLLFSVGWNRTVTVKALKPILIWRRNNAYGDILYMQYVYCLIQDDASRRASLSNSREQQPSCRSWCLFQLSWPGIVQSLDIKMFELLGRRSSRCCSAYYNAETCWITLKEINWAITFWMKVRVIPFTPTPQVLGYLHHFYATDTKYMTGIYRQSCRESNRPMLNLPNCLLRLFYSFYDRPQGFSRCVIKSPQCIYIQGACFCALARSCIGQIHICPCSSTKHTSYASSGRNVVSDDSTVLLEGECNMLSLQSS